MADANGLQIKGVPSSFSILVDQWQVQRLSRFVGAPGVRRELSANQKNAWTKWERLHNKLRRHAGFDDEKAGRPPYPLGVSTIERERRMKAAAAHHDDLREETNLTMNSYYKQIVADMKNSGLVEGRNRGPFAMDNETFLN